MEILFFQILFATVVTLITVIRQMKKEHKRELEHYRKEYRDISEELFRCEIKLFKKENEE